MILLPLGIGNGFSKKYFHSNLLLDLNNERLLIDAGTTLRYSLDHAKIPIDSIDLILITHFHHDHVGGLSEYLTACYWRFISGEHKPHRPILLLRPSQLEDIENLLSPTLNNQGLIWQDYCTPYVMNDDTYSLAYHDLQVIPTDFLHCEGLKSCGLKINHRDSGSNIIISGDIKHLNRSEILSYVNCNTKAIIQDIAFNQNNVHSTYEEVINYYPKDIYKLVYGIHYEDEVEINKVYAVNLVRQSEAISFELKG